MRFAAFASAAAIAAGVWSTAGVAQGEAPTPATATGVEPSEIIVTARKRSESAIDVPVSLTALGPEQLRRYNSSDIVALTTQVPGLFASYASASATLALRGVSSSPGNPAADQGVSVNIDGLQVGSPLILSLAQIDLAQVEVLKGPQALFFGKNSPGGIISMRTADPTDRFEVSGIAGYGFRSSEASGQLVLSAPISETLGVRLVAYGNRIEGDVRNPIPVVPGISFGPEWKHAPNQRQLYLRGTLLFRPSAALSVRAKYARSTLRGSNPFATSERIFCPQGTPQVLGLAGVGVDDCRANGVSYTTPALSPDAYAAAKAANFPLETKDRTNQDLASLEANLAVAPEITLTSLTGYYRLSETRASNVALQPAPLFPVQIDSVRREITQEIRLATAKTDWPVNFLIGGYFQDLNLPSDNLRLLDRYVVTRTLPLGTFIPSGVRYHTRGTTYSMFASAQWEIVRGLELAGGARYSRETKKFDLSSGANGATFVNVVLPVSRRTFHNVSPEATLTWKPTGNLSLFGAFRNGFKSGGFNAGGAGGDLSYKQEKIRGFEAGIKGRVADIRFNATAYTYRYTDAQVYTFNPTTAVQTVLNAANARLKGVEADATWTPRSLPGVELHGSVNYNHARYTNFILGCYVGQSITAGCRAGTPNAAGVYNQQNLSGTPLVLAPDWTGNAGFVYDTGLADTSLRLSMSGDVSFSSSYVTILENAPGGTQSSYRKINASIRLADKDRRWELALIGNNLTDRRNVTYSAAVPFTGSAATTGTNLPSGLADIYGFLARGREIRLQLSFKL